MRSIILTTVIALGLTTPAFGQEFRDNFNFLNTDVWTASDWVSPAYRRGNHYGEFLPEHVWVENGYLVLKLTQTIQDGIIFSAGAEVRSNNQFSYGTYEFRVRFSSSSSSATVAGEPVSGSVSAAFVYSHDPFAEIDIEVENSKPDTVHTVSWFDNDENKEHQEISVGGLCDQFRTYTVVWNPDSINYYIDGDLISTHEAVVPKPPVQMYFNHWGTNSRWWGGRATVGADRYMLVDYFSYTPLN